MHIEVITNSPNDTEICVSCPYCKYWEYFDPRPDGTHGNGLCVDCERLRKEFGDMKVCPVCKKESPLTGDSIP